MGRIRSRLDRTPSSTHPVDATGARDHIEMSYAIDLVTPGPPPCLCPFLSIGYLNDPRVRVVVTVDSDLPAALQREYLARVASGLDLLGRAAAAPDPAAADRLHDRAHGAFLTAARLVHTSPHGSPHGSPR